MTRWKRSVNDWLTRLTGYELVRTRRARGSQRGRKQPRTQFPTDYDESYRAIISAVRPFTMTANDKLHALITATRYVHQHGIPGAVVECGVWRGGSMHAVARTLDELAQLPYPQERFHCVPGRVEDTVPGPDGERAGGRQALALTLAGARRALSYACRPSLWLLTHAV